MFLILIFILGALLRFYRLGEIPVGLHRDEAFLGYNAYSLLKTAKDMSGNFLPLHLASFLYSPAGYSYFSIPFIQLFDLSAFSVRFASALFGSLTVLITYFLVQELFKKQNVALLSSLFLAISPWHINLSRTATENTVVVFFITLGIFLYISWMKKKHLWLLIAAFISFGITIFVYQAPRAFLPIFIPVTTILFLGKNVNRKNVLLLTMFFIITIIVPLSIILSSRELSLRIRTVSIFATGETQLILDEQIREDGVSETPNFLTRVYHNKFIGYSMQYLSNYFKHFTYDFLFTDQGFPARYHTPLIGLLYIAELPLLFAGIVYLLTNKNRAGLFLLSWMAIAPLGSSLAFDDVPNLQRTLLIFPSLSILSSLGLLYLLSFCRKRPLIKSGLTIVIVGALTCNLLFYLHQYYVHGPLYRPWYRQDGYKELVEEVNIFLPNYQKAIITDRESAPTIFFLFYGKYDPAKFQRETKNSTMRDFDRINFGKYTFSQEECPATEKNMKREILYVNSGFCKAISGIKEYKEIKRKDNSVVFRIVDLQ